MPRLSPYQTVKRADRLANGGHDTGPFGGGWSKIVHEFRNHLTMVLAGTTELRATLPPSATAHYADTFEDMESSVHFLDTLLTWMDASVSTGPQAIAEAGDLLRRAHTLALPGLRNRVTFSCEVRPAGVRNRGSVVECALAALITELGRAADPDPPIDTLELPLYRDITATVRATERGSVEISLVSSTGQPAPAGWRVLLAESLLAKVGATVEISRAGAGFVVRFRQP
jgi:hypothetical protein